MIIIVIPMTRIYEKGIIKKPLTGMRSRSPNTNAAIIIGTTVDNELLTGNATDTRRCE
jgi:hypothetical protein